MDCSNKNPLKICPSVGQAIGNVALTVILFGVQHMMEKNNPCPCDPKWNSYYFWIYFIVFSVVLFLLSLLTLPDSRKLLKSASCCTSSRGETSTKPGQGETNTGSTKTCWTCVSVLVTLMKVSIPSVIWVAILFLDGDYYTCYWLTSINQTTGSKECKDFCNITASLEERRLCFVSRFTGAILMVTIVILLVVSYVIPRCRCTKSSQQRYYEEKFQKLLEKKIKEELGKKAAEHAVVEVRKILGKLKLGNTEQGQQQSNQSTDNNGDDDNTSPDRGERPLTELVTISSWGVFRFNSNN